MSDPALRSVTREWLAEPTTAAVFGALEAASGTPRFVGGCVRDALRGHPVADIDIAIDLDPGDVVAALEVAGIRAIPTGIDHGTITAVVDARAVEITSLRRDVETDGRRAVVSFTKDWREDSERRDFTFNALYADRAGAVMDFHGGIEDLERKRLRFIGDPDSRIREDVLRILRFFRFMAQMGIATPDASGLEACRARVSLLPSLSAERVARELTRLLEQSDPLPVLGVMKAIGALDHWLPEAADEASLAALVALETARNETDPVRRLGVLCAGSGGRVGARLKLSAAAQSRLDAMDVRRDAPHRPRVAVYGWGVENSRDAALIGLARGDAAWRDVLEAADRWTPPTFPLKGADVLALGLAPGPDVGTLLDAVEADWIDADFAWDRPALLSRLEARINQDRP